MEIKNITNGDILRNYYELCEALEIEPTTGNAKKAQIEELKRYCRFSKVGNKFYIREIYEEPKEQIIVGRGSEYAKLNELVLCHLILNFGKDDKLIVTPTVLAEKMGYINKFFTQYWNKKGSLSELKNVSLQTVDEFYERVSKSYRGIILNTINRMEKQRIIFSEEVIYVVAISKIGKEEINEILIYGEHDGDEDTHRYSYGGDMKLVHREATDEEKNHILEIENRIMTMLGCGNMQEIYAKNLSHKYYDIVKKEFVEKLRIRGWYKAYRITFLKDAVFERKKSITKEIVEINKSFLQNTIENKKKRKFNEKKDCEEFELLCNELIKIDTEKK